MRYDSALKMKEILQSADTWAGKGSIHYAKGNEPNPAQENTTVPALRYLHYSSSQNRSGSVAASTPGGGMAGGEWTVPSSRYKAAVKQDA